MSLPAEVDLARSLIRCHSPSGAEGPAARELARAFRELGFDEVELDGAGNAVASFRRGEGRSVLLAGHVDTVPAGDEALWPYPPFSGEIAGGRLWGRGSCDMKGAVACMAVAARDAAERGFAGTLSVAGVVQEEVGGLGARFLSERRSYDVVVLGEPSNLRLMLGHRGRIEVLVRLGGRIAHAAKPELGDNALYRAARFLERLQAAQLPGGTPLGASTATPTALRSYPEGANVVPGLAELTIDYRNVPGDEPEAVLERLAGIDPEARLTIPEERAVSESGEVSYRFPRVNPSYLAPSGAAEVEVARKVLRGELAGRDRTFSEGFWWFATDAPFLAARGAPVVGFGPGEPELAHTSREGVELDQLAVARAAYTELALAYLGRS